MAVDTSFAPNSNYHEQGGVKWDVGGTLDILSGGTLAIAGTDRTAVLATAPAAVAAGYKLARGTGTLDGSNPTSVITGLASCVALTVNLVGTAAPGVSTDVLTVDLTPGTGQVDIYGWKNTGAGTQGASTGTDSFAWIALGT
jgi:hypothetical protein